MQGEKYRAQSILTRANEPNSVETLRSNCQITKKVEEYVKRRHEYLINQIQNAGNFIGHIIWLFNE